MNDKVTEEEKKAFEKNEERLWDMTALTVSSAIASHYDPIFIDQGSTIKPLIAKISYDLADVLILERRKRLKK